MMKVENGAWTFKSDCCQLKTFHQGGARSYKKKKNRHHEHKLHEKEQEWEKKKVKKEKGTDKK